MAEIKSFALDQVNSCVGSCYRGNGLRVVTVVMALFCLPAHAWDPTCKPIGELYQNGEAICNKLFGDSFMYSTDEERAYTMWWFDSTRQNSPNLAAVKANDIGMPYYCRLEYTDKTVPGPEGNITECHPWKEHACCDASTVKSAETLNKRFGAGYEWDRCGPMSDECARFFVQEACFYECDVTIGNYRKYTDKEAANASHEGFNNTWEIHKMPIKASYCNAWHDACRNDYFCDSDDGFFGCNAPYWENQENATDGAAQKALDDAAAAAAAAQKALDDAVAANATAAAANAAQKALDDAVAAAVANATAAAAQQALDDAVAAAAAQQALDDADADKLAPGIIAVIISAVVLIVLLCVFLCYMARKEKKGQPLFHPLVDSDERRPSPAQPSKA